MSAVQRTWFGRPVAVGQDGAMETGPSVSRQHVDAVFADLAAGWQGGFLRHVSPQVRWQVLGSHPLAGDYRTVEDFVAGTSARLDPRLRDPLSLHVVGILLAGAWAVVELTAESVQNNGRTYRNEYCWLVRFDSEGLIVEVRSYLDSAAVADVIRSNDGP